VPREDRAKSLIFRNCFETGAAKNCKVRVKGNILLQSARKKTLANVKRTSPRLDGNNVAQETKIACAMG